jgi:PST family polysaccharide transporter
LFSFNQIFLFFINGEGDTKLFTIISIYQSLIILILSFIFVYFYRLEGALLVISISQVIISFISFYYVLKKRIFKLNNFLFSLNNEYTKTLFSYTAITFVNALSVAISLIVIRNILIDRFGIEQTGYWQAVWNISEVYLGFITMLLSVYFYPKISSLLQEKEKLKIEIKMIVLFVTFLSLLTISVTYMLKEFIVTILYTDEFIESVIFFKYLLIGDFFKILSWIFGYYMLSMMATKAIIISTIISSILFVSLTHLFTLHYGIEGVNYAYVIVYVSYLIFTVVYTRRNIYER